MMRYLVLFSLFLWFFCGSALALPEETWVIAIGNNRGDASDVELLYAERDAREMAEVLRSQGNVASDRVRLLINENADTVRRTLTAVNTTLRAASADAPRQTALLVFYSGHADAEDLHLRGSRLPFEELRSLVTASPATVRLFIIDACRSGMVTRVKGVVPAPEFKLQLDSRVDVEGTAIIASSTADESSQESDRLRGSFFSHHLVNALRGAADVNGDGRVTLDEAYAYTRAQTLRSSGQTLALQHPTYAYDVKGSGELVMTTVVDNANAGSRLRLAGAGTYLLTEEKESGLVVAEFTTLRSRALVALPQGRYFIQQRGSLEYREFHARLKAGEETDLEQLPHRSVAYDQLVRKRGGSRPSVHGLTLLLGGRGQVLAGEGVTPNLVLGYSADLPWLTVGARLRGDTGTLQSIDLGLTSHRYELGLALLLQRYIDLPWFSAAFGISLEGTFEAQRYEDGPRQPPAANSLALSFGALLVLERRLHRGLSLRLEGGPLAILARRATLSSGVETGDIVGSIFTWWAAGGLVWRL